MSMKSENREIIEQLKEMKIRYALQLENKDENEQSLLNEIRLLHNKLGGDEPRRLDSDFESRSNFDSLSAIPEDMYRESYARPLSDFGDDKCGMSEKVSYRKRRFNQKD